MLYATLQDIANLFRPLTEAEKRKASALLPIVCAELRLEAKRQGIDLDEKAQSDADFAQLLKSVTVDIVARTLLQNTNAEALTQFSESALGYSQGGTYLNPGGGIFIKKTELARLGLKRQKIKTIEFYGEHSKC